jgi:hypothetical protein
MRFIVFLTRKESVAMFKFRLFFLIFLALLQVRLISSASADTPFSKEVSLLGGISRGRGDGLSPTTAPASAFFYARSFKDPKPEHFLLRVIADTVVTEFKTSSTPISLLSPLEPVTAVLIRFGFSGCYLWNADWMGCLDDGPRLSYLLQGSSNSQTLGSFPLGGSLHFGGFFPWMVTTRAEYGRWDSKVKGAAKNNTASLFLIGAGYNW